MEKIKPFTARETNHVVRAFVRWFVFWSISTCLALAVHCQCIQVQLLSGELDASTTFLSAPHLYPTDCPTTPAANLHMHSTQH